MEAFSGKSGRTELIRKAAYHMHAAGEATLVGTPIDTGSGILWEFLSVVELHPSPDGVMMRRRAGLSSDIETLDDDVYMARLLNPSPVYSDLAQSEVRRVLPIVSEIKSLTQMVDATVKSRIPANMLFIPEGMTIAGVGDTDDASPMGDDGVGTLVDIDELVDDIWTHMNQSQIDPNSGARLVPLVVLGEGEQGKYIRVIELSRELDGWAQDLRNEALSRLAKGLDSPPELMTGRASVNHWTSAIIDQDFLIKHIQPIGQLIADFITESYLRPMLQTFEGMSEEEAYQWRVEFDPSPVMARADEAKSARDLRDLLSDEAILAANGFDKTHAVTPETKAERRVWQLIETNPTIFAPLLLQLPGWEDFDLTEVLDIIAQMAAGAALGVTGGIEEEEEGDEQAQNDDEIIDATSGQETPDRPEGLAVAILAAADTALDAALQKAASRFVSGLQGNGQDAELRTRLRSVNKMSVMASISDNDVSAAGFTRDRLLRDAWNGLYDQTLSHVSGHLMDDNMDAARAHETAALAAQVICDRMHDWVVENLHSEFRKRKNGFRVPTSIVTDALEDVLPIPV